MESSTTDDVESVHKHLIGLWQYGSKFEYRIVLAAQGGLLFVDQKKSGSVSGLLKSDGDWLLAELLKSDSEEVVGSIRLRFESDSGKICSNFLGAGKQQWGKDKFAVKIERDVNKSYVLGQSGVGELPNFVSAEAASVLGRVIQTFVMLNIGSPELTQITGGRYEVFLTGVKSEPFRTFVEHHTRKEEVLKFLSDLQGKLADVAFANVGKLSEDIVALVGSPEMQAPHVDLKRGMVQMIVALSATAPTYVYDPCAEKPSLESAFQSMGVDTKYATSKHLRYLTDGATPLALPVQTLYERMVPACECFEPGDAVQIGDSIVHAGPAWEEKPGRPPRIVIFATYSTLSSEKYNVDFQYKFWDWASFAEVPPMIAYKRLLESRSVTQAMGIRHVCPWVYFSGKRSEACKTLCLNPDLPQDKVEDLVQQWRGRESLPVALEGSLSEEKISSRSSSREKVSSVPLEDKHPSIQSEQKIASEA